MLDAECDEETRQAKDLGCLTSLYEVVKLTYFHPSEEVHHHHFRSARRITLMIIMFLMYLICMLSYKLSACVHSSPWAVRMLSSLIVVLIELVSGKGSLMEVNCGNNGTTIKKLPAP